MSQPKILSDALNGNAGLFLQFGGQGAPWYKELKKYYDSGSMKELFEAALDGLDAERPNVEGRAGLPDGIDARKWLEDESSIPSEDYLGCAAVSIPMIQLTQLAHFEALVQEGYDRDKIVEAAAGATGHSQGLIPATLVAMGLTGSEYYDAVKKYMQYILYIGVRAQDVFPNFAATDEESKKAEELGAAGPAPMVAVLGADHKQIEDLVEKTNKNLAADKQIYVSLYNSPSNRILSSYRSSLIRFHEENKAFIEENKVKFVYLRTTCPFHCDLMKPMLDPFKEDAERIGFKYKGSDLKIPVYSFYDGSNYQEEGEFAMKLATDMVLHRLDWGVALKPAAQNSKVTHIIDFGPGKTSQRLSNDSLAALDCKTPVLAAAFAKDFKALTES